VDPGKRKELYSKAQKIIADEAYWVPLYNAKVISAMSKNLNFKPSYDEIDRYFTAAYAD
jgi:peptide/nickel transport system substrate-binding protein